MTFARSLAHGGFGSGRRSEFHVFVRAIPLLALFAFAGCSGSGKRDAASLSEAMDRFRRAPNATKPSLFPSVRDVSCRTSDVCAARTACVASADATTRGLRMNDEVAEGLRALESGKLARESAEARGLAAKLVEAQSLIDEGFQLLTSCDEHLLVLRRAYQL